MDYREWFKEQIESYEKDPDFILDRILLDINETICGKLEKKGLSRRELAQRLGVSPAYVSKILRGDPNLTLKSLIKISQALGLALDVGLKEPEAVKKGERNFEKDDFESPNFETTHFDLCAWMVENDQEFIAKAS